MLKKSTGIIFFVLMAVLFLKEGLNAKTFTEQVTSSVKQGVEIRQETQTKENMWFQEKKKLMSEYKALEHDYQILSDQEHQLLEEIGDREITLSGLEKSLTDMEEIASDLDPFLKKVLIEIDSLVENGFPMLADERKNRVASLKKLVQSDEATISEKFRKTMEVLFIEANYGNTIEVYQENIILQNEPILADIFRLGRVSLFCKTPDGKLTGFYDWGKTSWQPLPASYNKEISRAVEMGTKRRAMDFLTLPLGRVVVQ